MSLRETILDAAAKRQELERITVSEWECDVWIRRWTAKEREEYERDFGDADKNGTANIRARVVVRALLDETGERVFSDADAATLGDTAADVISRLFREMLTRAGLLQSDLEAAKKN